ncbi:MAG: methyltransferase domain-containing protein [Deltaproteobacteria bacterium]|nr:methyltransferase domain-containing protein [Deltaproteobacteria bacterium]MBW1815980.1 methyltransferase domain-containing protein [Deltaproteobacteria bacterium]
MVDLFDEWPEAYDRWFETPIGRVIWRYERELLLDMLHPAAGEHILDAGCGTGIFTMDWLAAGARVVGLELSMPMLRGAGRKLEGQPFLMIRGDMRKLPFGDGVFDKSMSITALEFIEDGDGAMAELFRVTRPGGRIVVATLNSLGPWAERRRKAAGVGHALFQNIYFRSPEELRALSPFDGDIRSAIHFQKDHTPEQASVLEERGRSQNLQTGAFLAGCWENPE